MQFKFSKKLFYGENIRGREVAVFGEQLVYTINFLIKKLVISCKFGKSLFY